jgi:hypothetical protein
MYYYHIKLRLGGSTTNQIEKTVSAPEFLVLQFIHGEDAITDVRELRKDKVSQREEKERLRGLYENALVKSEQSINSIFGALGSLPERLPYELLEKFDIGEEEISEPINTNKSKKVEDDSDEELETADDLFS